MLNQRMSMIASSRSRIWVVRSQGVSLTLVPSIHQLSSEILICQTMKSRQEEQQPARNPHHLNDDGGSLHPRAQPRLAVFPKALLGEGAAVGNDCKEARGSGKE